jgi:site-specific DNA-cytosine methylase
MNPPELTYGVRACVPAQHCEWREDDPNGDMSGTYASACGELWSFNDGGPKENNVRFCQGCGKPVQVLAFVEECPESGKHCNVIDGDHMRMLTAGEARTAMGFPSTYQLPERHKDAMHMLGNAVVPPVACDVINAIQETA